MTEFATAVDDDVDATPPRSMIEQISRHSLLLLLLLFFLVFSRISQRVRVSLEQPPVGFRFRSLGVLVCRRVRGPLCVSITRSFPRAINTRTKLHSRGEKV